MLPIAAGMLVPVRRSRALTSELHDRWVTRGLWSWPLSSGGSLIKVVAWTPDTRRECMFRGSRHTEVLVVGDLSERGNCMITPECDSRAPHLTRGFHDFHRMQRNAKSVKKQ